ncbi:hypothetical protein Val02_25860 [Virgisporangium aliadipatigenens]|uniref:Uncharacterized protein n=1 Tax=Virgisporangium aliadipatigenens TaxID=741659 RepID=A0A8J4DP91_9ACTN|nr:hypothetical protein [Virgisporangium aliadipatigenens]GIJ45700.1 hypothetical protein Val02_25860 [Virgisporangium aliadipatigenens]
MATVTADDIRVLAQSDLPDAALILDGDDVRVAPGIEVREGQVLLTKISLVSEVGEDVTDVDAELMAAGLTAKLP